MKTKRWDEVRSKSKLTAAERAEVDQEVRSELLAMSLREVREFAQATQAELAAALETTQAQLSRFERREDFFLSTLRRYIEALGGELEVVARFGDHSVRLKGV